MTINATKPEQAIDIAFTAENKGKVGLNIDTNVQKIKIVKKIGKTIPTSGAISAELIGSDFSYARIGTAGAAGAITEAIKRTELFAFGSRVVTLSASDLTKTSGLELDFGLGSSLPTVGDSVIIESTDSVAKDGNIIGRRLFVLSVNGSKAKLMNEVPSAAALPSTGDLIVTLTANAGKQPVFEQGFDVTSVEVTGELVTLKGSAPEIFGSDEAKATLHIPSSSKLIPNSKKKSGSKYAFVVVSSTLGEIKVLDPNGLISAAALGTDFLGTVMIGSVGGFTFEGAPVDPKVAYIMNSAVVDLTNMPGAVAGDQFKVFASYGGDI